MKRLLAAAALTACLGLAAPLRADTAEADALYAAGSFEEAFAAYAERAKEEDGQAMLRMAQMFEAGEGVSASRTRALTWYRRAAAHDVAEAHFRIGAMFETGTGVPRDYAASVRAYRSAADLGHIGALVALANLYADGSGAMPDTSEAARLLKQAADTGDAQAIAALDRLVASGTVPRGVLDDLGIPPPPPPVLPTVEELAAQGIAAQDDSAEPATTAAQAAESEAAARVRAALVSQLAGFDGNEDAFLDYGIDIAEDTDGSMVATVRDLRLVSPDGTWEIGDLVYDLTPVDDWTFDAVVSLPQATAIFDDQGRAVGGTSLGAQDLRGTWNVALNLWSRSDIDLRDIALDLAPPGEDAMSVTIAAISGNSRLDAQDGDKWSGPGTIAIEGVALRSAGGEAASIAHIDIAMDQRAVDYVFFQAMGLVRAEMESRFGTAPDLDDPATQSAMQELLGPVLALARERAPLVGDIGMDIEVRGIAGISPESGQPFALERLHLGIAGRGLDAPSGTVTLAYEHSGLSTGDFATTQGYLPGEAAFIVSLQDLPVAEASTMALEMFEQGLADPASLEDNAMMALAFFGMGLQQSMAGAGSSLQIERIAFVSPALKANMTGALVATTSSPLGATGTVTLDIEGLDAAVAELSAMGEDPDAREMAMPLAMLQAMGKRVEEGGIVRHLYVMELTPDGRTLLNGNDMGPMMEGMMGGGATIDQ